MFLAKVKGNVVGTEKHKCFSGHKLLIVQPIDEYGNEVGETIIACDSVKAGAGEVVLVEQEGNSARQILGKMDEPFHSVIVGIVDKVYVKHFREYE